MKIKRSLISLTAVLVSATANVSAADPDPRMIMPGDIQPVQLKAGERNPFEKRVELKTEREVEAGAELSEEDRVRKKFNELEVRGGSPGVRILLSDMILEKGKFVDPVLVDQTIQLIVTSISSNEIELSWADDVGKTRPRTIVLPYDLSPKVGFLLSGQSDLAEDEKRVISERVMTRGERPAPPTIKAVDANGVEREVDGSQIVGQ